MSIKILLRDMFLFGYEKFPENLDLLFFIMDYILMFSMIFVEIIVLQGVGLNLFLKIFWILVCVFNTLFLGYCHTNNHKFTV